MAEAPPKPDEVEIGGAVEPSTTLRWKKSESESVNGYKIYWRSTSAPLWQHSKFVGDVSEFTLEGIVIDNYLFGVSAVGKNGHESVVAYPGGLIRD